MTRNGKIARLPKHVRDELNRRLRDGEEGKKLVEWLNIQESVREVLKDKFAGRAITEQNLSEWKNGGYVEWVQDEETCERVCHLAERAGDLENAAGEADISDLLSRVLAAELADAAAKLKEIADSQERWKRFREILRELARLRQEDHRAQRVQLERERWDSEIHLQERADDKEHEEQFKERVRNMLMAPMEKDIVAQGFGGGEHGRKMADLLEIVNSGQSMEQMNASLKKLARANKPPSTKSGSIQPNPTESDPIQPESIESDSTPPD
ncbi:MAG TPA: hypothetical protein VGN23_05835 [Verrucomicrobiae bacterium]|jgi:hypothetical protein